MEREKIKNSALLLLTACIWGVAFVAQSVGMEYVGPYTFNFVRSILGGLVLIPVIIFRSRTEKQENTSLQERKKQRKTLLIGGGCCGVILCLATNVQQIGIQYTTVGKAGFITACYIVIVPFLYRFFFRKKLSPLIWLAVVLAVGGLYLLCITEEFVIGKGDILVFMCALLFSVHILIVDYFSPKTDGVKLSCIQFLVSGCLSGVAMLLTEQPEISAVLLAWKPIAYAGILSCGVGYTLQIIGQKNMNPTVASLIMSLESCISVLAGWILLGQTLSLREGLGCLIMFAAIVLAQLPAKGN